MPLQYQPEAQVSLTQRLLYSVKHCMSFWLYKNTTSYTLSFLRAPGDEEAQAENLVVSKGKI